MAITVVGTTKVEPNANTTSIVLPVPTGLAVNDLLLFEVAGSISASPSPPSGLTTWEANVVFGPSLVSWFRWVDGTEPASYTITTSSGRFVAICVARRGVDRTTPKDTASVSSSSTTAMAVPPSITTVTAGAHVLCWGAGLLAVTGDTTPSWTTDGTINQSAAHQLTTNQSTLCIDTSRVVASPGTVTPTLTLAEGASRSATLVSALRPAAAAPATLDDLRWGSSTVGLRLGSATPSKAYKGSTQVWP